MTQHAVSAESRERTAALLSDLWQRNLPLVEQRMGVLERAAAARSNGDLAEDLRAEASNVAHKLAGSLGMFGFERGTEIAREIELALESRHESRPHDAFRLSSLTAQLRSILFAKS